MLLAFARFYGIEYFPCWDEVLEIQKTDPGRYIDLRYSSKTPMLFDTVLFATRMKIVASTFLMEASARAAAATSERTDGVEVRAVCHVVGLGLGVWKVVSQQNQLYVDAFAMAAKELPAPVMNVLTCFTLHMSETPTNVAVLEKVNSCPKPSLAYDLENVIRRPWTTSLDQIPSL